MVSSKLVFRRDLAPVIETIKEAKEFIKIVIFQITSERIIELLKARAKEGISVEIIALPADSYKKPEARQVIKKFYEELRAQGAQVYICDWEVGDASLTDTSQSGQLAEGGGDKWYSLHGKLLLTDQNALILTANLIDVENLDAYLMIYDLKSRKDLLDNFQKIHELFIESSGLNTNITGKVYDRFSEQIQQTIDEMWRMSQRKNVKSYDLALLSKAKITPGLKICPFDGKARDFLEQLVMNSTQYLYICSERIFDEEFISLIRTKMESSPIQIKILARPPYMVRQSPDKAANQALQLLSLDVEFKCLKDIHAKLWLSDQWLMIGSSNIVKMSLGFPKTKKTWRANTEILYFTDDKLILEQAKKQFESSFEDSEAGLKIMGKRPKSIKIAKNWFDTYSIESSTDARILLNQIMMHLDIQLKKNIQKIVKYAIKINNSMETSKIEQIHVAMAFILFELQFKALTKAELLRLYDNLLNTNLIKESLTQLLQLEFITYSKAQITINIEKLLNG